MTSKSEHSLGVALLLCFFLGGLGMHRFYAGKGGSGFLMPVTLVLGRVRPVGRHRLLLLPCDGQLHGCRRPSDPVRLCLTNQ